MKSLDIGCGHFPHHRTNDAIGLDLHKGKCDIVADAQHLPFRPEVFDFVYVIHLLEHLPEPMLCLRDIKYVLKVEGVLIAGFPITTHFCKDAIKKLCLMFYLPRVVKNLIKWHRLKSEKGFWHISEVKPKDIARVFRVVSVKEKRPRIPIIWRLIPKLVNPHFPTEYLIIANRSAS